MTVTPLGPPESVPVYNCVVHLRREAGLVRAVVANLQDLEVDADSERAALRRVVEAFKRIVAECLEQDREIPWRDPPRTLGDGEVERLIPLHL